MSDVCSPPAPALLDAAAPRPDGAATGSCPDPGPLAFRLLVSAVILIPLSIGWVLWAAPGADNDFNRRVTLAPFDLALVAVVAAHAVHRLRSARTGPARPVVMRSKATRVALLGAATLVAALGSFAAHPSWRGLDLGLRVLAGVVIVDVVRRADRDHLRRLCVAIVAGGVVQACLALAQSAHGRGFELLPLDYDGPLFRFGDQHAGRGGLSHPYHLVVFLLLGVVAALVAGRRAAGRERVLWCAASAVLGAGMAVTFSRAMLLAVVPAGVALVAGARRLRLGRAVRPVLFSLAAGLACTAAVVSSGWMERAGQSTAADADRGRVEKARLGLEVAADHPLTGVGPGRYVLALEERGVEPVDLLPTHNLAAQALAELGLVGGALLLALLARGAAHVVRTAGAVALAGAWMLVPFLLLDSYAYVFPTGLALSAVWIGLVTHPGLRRAAG